MADHLTFTCTGRGSHKPRPLTLELRGPRDAEHPQTVTTKRKRLSAMAQEIAEQYTVRLRCKACGRDVQRRGEVIAEWLASDASTIDISTLA